MCFGNYAKLPADAAFGRCLHSAVPLLPRCPPSVVACRILVVLRQRFAYFAADYHLLSGLRSSFHKQLIMLKRILALTAGVASSRHARESSVWPQSVAVGPLRTPTPHGPTLSTCLAFFGCLAICLALILSSVEMRHTTNGSCYTHTHHRYLHATHSCGRHSMSRYEATYDLHFSRNSLTLAIRPEMQPVRGSSPSFISMCYSILTYLICRKC